MASTSSANGFISTWCIFRSIMVQLSAMDPSRIMLDIGDAFVKAYSAALGKPYAKVRVQLVPQPIKSDPESKQLLAFTIVNESSPTINVQKAWFLTNYNRRVFSEFISSRLPVIVPGRKRSTYFFPFEELKSTLSAGKETITQAFIYDKAQNQYSGRVDEAVEIALAK